MGTGTRTPTRIENYMSSPVETVEHDASLVEASGLMHEAGIKAVVVRTDPLSILTSTDVVRVVSRGEDTTEIPAAEAATEISQTATPDDYLQEAASAMLRHGISHLPVVDGDDLVGIITTTDITERRID
ncbi:MAG: CBS domain-containing protein [Natronomonas sp.]|jgi:CBS domain-containing protein